MKIYPGNNDIIATNEVNLNIDIPLAYIDTTTSSYTANIIPLLQKEEKSPVVPYTYFNTLNMCFFDENNNKLMGANYLDYDGSRYKFKPELLNGSSSFIPLNFEYRVIGKRNCIYKSNAQYDIKVSCIDNPMGLPLSNKLISLFGNAPDRGICPSNIVVNSGSSAIQSLTNSSIHENDFIFIESSNGIAYKEYWTAGTYYSKNQSVYYNDVRYLCNANHTAASTWNADQHPVGDNTIIYWQVVEDLFVTENDTEINLEDYLQYNTNVWLSVEDFIPNKKISSSNTVSINNPAIIRNDNIAFPYSFNLLSIIQKEGVVVHNFFNSNNVPVIVYEYENKGFVIVTPKEFLNNITNYTNMFYEILMNIYMKSYMLTEIYTDWISDKMPNYIVLNNKLTQKEKFTSKLEAYNMFGLSKSEFSLIEVVIDKIKYPYVIFDSISNDFLIFKKLYDGTNAVYADKCDWNGISLYTQGKIIIIKNFIYTIEESISDKLTWHINNNKIYFNIDHFKSSSNNIDSITTTLNYDLVLKNKVLTSVSLYLCYSSSFSLINVDKYVESDGAIIAEIQIIKKDENKNTIVDMRQLGGGLPEDEDPIYDLFDIGDVNGKQYRKSGALVITVPARLKPYEDLIMNAVKKHMVAEDFPIILFE